MTTNNLLNMSTDYSYQVVLPYGQVQLRLDNTSFPYADGLNRELRVRQHVDSLRLVGGPQTPTLFSFNDGYAQRSRT